MKQAGCRKEKTRTNTRKCRLSKLDTEKKKHVPILESVDEKKKHVPILESVDEKKKHVPILESVDEKKKHVPILESVDEASWIPKRKNTYLY